MAKLEVAGRRVRVYNTHLEVSSADERRRQAEVIVDEIGEGEAVLAGDLNATADAAEIAALTDRFRHAGDRIDHVMASPEISRNSVIVVTAEPDASDHLPVVADLHLPSP